MKCRNKRWVHRKAKRPFSAFNGSCDARESNLTSSLYIYLFMCMNRGPHAHAIGILALVNSLQQKQILNYF